MSITPIHISTSTATTSAHNPLTEEPSTGSLEESVSLWMDSEALIDADQLDTPYGRQVWSNYHLIGDVLRTEALAIAPSDLFYARLTKAIDAEPEVLAPQHSAQRKIGRRWAVPATGVAAALLITLWLAQPAAIEEAAPVLAQADEVWVDYIDAHRSLTGLSPASYVSYTASASTSAAQGK